MRLSSEELITEYHHLTARKIILLAIIVIGIALCIGLLSVNTYDGIGLREAYKIVLNHILGNNNYELRSTEWWADRYIWNYAMPKACIAITAGAGLAICGTLMQSLMSNPLADPYSTGISSGACFGAVTSIIVGFTFTSVSGEMGIVTNAFIGAMVPAILVILISNRINVSPATLILIGTAVSYFFNSMVTYLMVMTDTDTLQDAYMWQIGSLDGMSWGDLPIMLIVTVIGSIFIMLMAKRLNIMSLGDSSARSLGLDVNKFRMVCLAFMAMMTAAVISYTGIIGFIGLVAPHLVRLAIGSDNKYVLPISMAAGALLLLIADYISVIMGSIPVGVIMGIIGSPIFFILIVWQKKGKGALY